MIKRPFLSDFSESKIELVGHILIIDGKRYVNRGPWLIDDIDLKERIVYKDNLDGDAFFADVLTFDEVELIPLFATTEKDDGQRNQNGKVGQTDTTQT